MSCVAKAAARDLCADDRLALTTDDGEQTVARDCGAPAPSLLIPFLFRGIVTRCPLYRTPSPSVSRDCGAAGPCGLPALRRSSYVGDVSALCGYTVRVCSTGLRQNPTHFHPYCGPAYPLHDPTVKYV